MNATLSRKEIIVVAGELVSIDLTDPHDFCDTANVQPNPIPQPAHPWPQIQQPAVGIPISYPWPGTSGPHTVIHIVDRPPDIHRVQGKWWSTTGVNKIQARWTANMKG